MATEMTLGSVIDAVIPYIIIIVAIFILYKPLKEPLKGLWGLIGGAFNWMGNKKDDAKEVLFSKKEREIEFQ